MTNGNKQNGKKDLARIHGEKCWPTVDKISPCEDACPIHMDVPSYVIALTLGKIDEALEVVRDTNPFPSICGRVCHNPCEEACTRSQVDRPIAIKSLKRFIGDYEKTNGFKPEPVKRSKEERVAIIGSGPAGLTAAQDLVKDGYGVSVYEALPIAGGMLAAGIPEFMLAKDIVKAEVNQIKALGVDIKTNMKLGKHVSIDDLKKQGYKAILLATGAWKNMELPIPGADLRGVTQALDFLRDTRLGKLKKIRGIVAVIGGGNVAFDAARTAARMGAGKVIVACLESRTAMPAYDWKVEIAEGEGVEVRCSLAAQQFNKKPVDRIGGIAFKKVESTTIDMDGRISWTLAEGPDADVSMDVDNVIIAIGQQPDASIVEGVDLAENGGFKIDSETMSTNLEGIFAAGDAVKMPGTIVGAIAAGHAAAKAIRGYLGDDVEAPEADKEVFQVEEDITPGFLLEKDRWDLPSLSAKDAIRTFAEAELGYPLWQAVEEAKRCMNCRMCGNCLFGRGQLCLETSRRLLASV